MSTAPATAAPFVFDKDYDNLAQVAHLWDAYAARRAELESAGEYPYDDSFKGHIEGLVADDRNETSAIFLLQVTRRVREYEEKVQALHAQGYIEPVVPLDGDHLTKYASVALVGRQYSGGKYGTVTMFAAARVYTRSGQVCAVLPKGARTRGHSASSPSYVLVKK